MANSQVFFTHLTGSPFARNAAIALYKAGLLSKVLTTLAFEPDTWLSNAANLVPGSWHDRLVPELKRRTWSQEIQLPIQVYPWPDLARLALTRTGLGKLLKIDPAKVIDWEMQLFDRHVAHHLQESTAVYAYEDTASTTFEVATKQGIRCFYDLPIVYYKTSQAIQLEEAERFPELASALAGVREPAWKLERKEQEIALADHIFVASTMTRRSLVEVGVSPDKISIIPYGAPIDYFQPGNKPDSTFRALFVGHAGPRKGVHYLLQAWKELRLPAAELLFVGLNASIEDWMRPYSDLFRGIPSVPHTELQTYYQSASVFVFPSLVEGFGLVLLEAMACGIPVITTPNTAAPDIITDGVEGFIIPIRDVEALKEKLEWCYRHPIELAEMGRAARRKAEQLTWNAYQQKLATQVMSLLGGNPCRMENLF